VSARQRVPFGLAQVGVIVEVAGDLAGNLYAHRLRLGRGDGCGPIGLVGQQVGHRGAADAPADAVVAGQGGDAGPVPVCLADLSGYAELGVTARRPEVLPLAQAEATPSRVVVAAERVDVATGRAVTGALCHRQKRALPGQRSADEPEQRIDGYQDRAADQEEHAGVSEICMAPATPTPPAPHVP
jgi:hypothetical protein